MRGLVQESEQSARGNKLLPKVGMRAFVDKVGAPGAVTSIDEFDLVHVHLDKPQSGQSDVEVPASLIYEERMVKVKKALVEIATMNFTAKGEFDEQSPPHVVDGAQPFASELLGVPTEGESEGD